MSDIFEKAFGKAPETGYDFRTVTVEPYDSERFKGLDFAWWANGVGFGHVHISWGMGEDVKRDWPKQFGFHTDTEQMSREFVEAMLHAAVPSLADLIMKNER